MTPNALAGLWRRRSLQLGDVRASEPAVVHWIQWGDDYLDMRAPIGAAQPLCGPSTFGGRTTWSDPVLTWSHELESEPHGGADEGTIRRLSDGLVEERGVAATPDGPLRYVEVWARVGPRPGEGRCWAPQGGALAVEAGPHRMAAIVDGAGTWCAGRSRRRGDGAWQPCEAVGDADLFAVLRPALLDGR